MTENITHHLRKDPMKSAEPMLRSTGFAKRVGMEGKFEATISHLLIIWSITGTGRLRTDGGELLIPEGHCAVVCPPASFHYDNLSKDSEICWITYDGGKIDELCLAHGLWTGVFRYPDPPVERLMEMGKQLDDANTRGENEWIRSLAVLVLESIANNLRRYACNKSLLNAERLAHQAVNQTALGVEWLAEKMDLHRKSLYALCKKETGCSPKEYINRIRMHRICRLVRYSTLSISEISGEAGFSDTAYFTKAFKKLFGKSLEEYQKNPVCKTYRCPLEPFPGRSDTDGIPPGCLPRLQPFSEKKPE